MKNKKEEKKQSYNLLMLAQINRIKGTKYTKFINEDEYLKLSQEIQDLYELYSETETYPSHKIYIFNAYGA
jgi:hypothetical protein